VTLSRRRVVRRQVVLDHRYLRLSLDTERDERGREHTFILGRGPDIAIVVPVWPDGTVTLLSQRRYGLRTRSIEAPGGHVDPGETPAQAARRELREETGVVARRVTKLLEFLPAIKLQQRFHVFLATGLREGRAAPESDEDVRNVRVPVDEAASRAVTGWIVHGPTIVALLATAKALWDERRRRELRLGPSVWDPRRVRARG
jgi:ADP-ribose pyrophosphatase